MTDAKEKTFTFPGFTERQREILKNDFLDPAVVKKLPYGGMVYVEHHYVTRELNRIFGPDGWDFRVLGLEHVGDHALDEKGAKVCVGYRAVCELQAGPYVGYGYTRAKVSQDVGFGSNTCSAKNLMDGHDNACKSAVSDGLKRCAYKLGNVLGLALYDKDQTAVRKSDGDVDADLAERVGKCASIDELKDLSAKLSPSQREAARNLMRERAAEIKNKGAGVASNGR